MGGRVLGRHATKTPTPTPDPGQVVSSAIVDKYIGESARVIREMFNYAKEHQPCIIFMDEIDAIGGKRFSEGTSADREVQRTLMELLAQLAGDGTRTFPWLPRALERRAASASEGPASSGGASGAACALYTVTD